MRRILTVVVLILAVSSTGFGAVATKPMDYKHNDVTCKGYLAWDDAAQGKSPAVLVVHEWWGINDYARSRAEQLAALGYVALAVDMYGEGKVTTDRAQAGAWATAMRKDRRLMRDRIAAALTALKDNPNVDPTRVGAIGYCFGGGVVLELARDNADIRGVVSFHGNLDTPNPELTRDLKASVLVCHGAEDSGIPMTAVAGFVEEMRAAKADFQVIIYSGAVHGFTNPGSAAHHPEADKRSWEAMKSFFHDIFGK